MANSAQTLYEILSKARSYDENRTLRSVWTSVFGVQTSGIDALQNNIADLGKLVSKAEKNIRSLSGVDPKLYSRAFDNIKKLVSISDLDQSWETGRRLLNEATMYGLQVSSDALSLTATSSIHIKKDQIAKVRNDIEMLLQELVRPNLTPVFKRYITDRLTELYVPVNKFRTTGWNRVVVALVTINDSMTREKSFLQGELKHEGNKDIFVKYINALAAVYHLVDSDDELFLEKPLIVELLEFAA